jgi:hypothetical protein
VLDGTILAGRVEGLENDEDGPILVGPEERLGLGKAGDVLQERGLSRLLVFQPRTEARIIFAELDRLTGRHEKGTVVEFVGHGKSAGLGVVEDGGLRGTRFARNTMSEDWHFWPSLASNVP